MDPSALQFDADAMLTGLREWVECESPTYDAAAVNRMMDLASRTLVLGGARIERIAGRMGFGDCVRATFPHDTPNVPGILLMGHFDTVHPIGTLAHLPMEMIVHRIDPPRARHATDNAAAGAPIHAPHFATLPGQATGMPVRRR